MEDVLPVPPTATTTKREIERVLGSKERGGQIQTDVGSLVSVEGGGRM